ncbi:MAG: glycosyltransferase family 39 protein [Candidatus Hydrogenedentes bacterium]|nr:glycosyltransferase family 39 protein [Candidatus Hydrogenedentota bacterium]
MKVEKRKYLFLFWYLFVILLPITVYLINSNFPSLWGDEIYGGLTFLRSGSYINFLIRLWSIGPEVAPIYPSILYLAHKIMGFQETVFRGISLFFGVLNIVIAFTLVSSLTNKKIGFLSAIILTISPLHLWYSPLLRPHILSFLLSSVSLLITTKIISDEKDKSLGILLTATNLTLILTHFAYFWLPIIESLCILTKIPKKVKHYFSISLANILIGLSAILYITFFVKTNNASFLSTKSLFEFVFIPLGLLDFEVNFLNSWSIFLQPIFFYGKSVPHLWDQIFYYTPYVLAYGGNAVLSIIILLTSLSHFINKFKRKELSPDPIFLLVIMGILYPSIVCVLEAITSSSLAMARYLFPSFLCKIGLILWAIENKINKPSHKLIFLSLLILYFSHNFILYTFTSPYSEWRKCLSEIESKLSTNDIIITGRLEEALTLHWNKKSISSQKNYKIYYSSSITSTTRGVNLLRSNYPNSNIWIIYSNQWNPNIPCILKEEFSKSTIPHQLTVFTGFEGITCAKVPPINYTAELTSNIQSYKCDTNFNWEEIKSSITNLILDILKSDESIVLTPLEKNKNLLDELIFPEGTAGFNTFPTITYLLCKKGAHNWAEALCKHFSDQTPIATFSWAIVKIEKSKSEELGNIIYKLKRQNIYLAYVTQPLIKAYSEKDFEKLLLISRKLKEEFYPLGWIFEEIAKDKLSMVNNEFFDVGVFPL